MTGIEFVHLVETVEMELLQVSGVDDAGASADLLAA